MRIASPVDARAVFGTETVKRSPRLTGPGQSVDLANLMKPARDQLHFTGAKAPKTGTQAADVQAHLATFPKFGPPPFNAAFHADRRETLLSMLPPNTTVVVPGAQLKPRNGDVDYQFRQESNFFYLTGFDEPEAVAILSNQPGMPKFTLVVPPRNPEEETWTGKRAGTDGAKAKYKADAAYDNDQLDSVLRHIAQQGGNIEVLDTVANMEHDETVRRLLHKALPDDQKLDGSDAQAAIVQMRLVKTPYEQALLKRACDISADAHMRAMKNAKLTDAQVQQDPDHAEGRNEGEVQAEVEYDFRRHGAVRQGYGTIAGGGANGCVLHYETNREFTKPGQLTLVDAGAEYGYYTADVTRTWPISGKFSPEQKAIYDIVLKAQEAGIQMTKPGVSFREIHQTCARIVTEGLVELGVLKGDPETLQKEGAYEPFFMHGTSHMLGLDVHDVPSGVTDAKVRQRNAAFLKEGLQPGMVFTVEPGIYIDPEVGRKLGVDPKWWGIGVRIEDDILVTPKGYENLSAAAPRTTADIEKLMA